MGSEKHSIERSHCRTACLLDLKHSIERKSEALSCGPVTLLSEKPHEATVRRSDSQSWIGLNGMKQEHNGTQGVLPPRRVWI